MRYLLLLALFLRVASAWGQNWRPLVPNENYAFRCAAASSSLRDHYLFFVHPLNNGELAQGDTVLDFPLSAYHSSRCPSRPIGLLSFIELRPGSVLGAKIMYGQGRSRVVLPHGDGSRSDTLHLLPRTLDTSYTLGGITVGQISKTWETLYQGIQDSVWRASTSLGPIVLSKTYGLLTFPLVIDTLPGVNPSDMVSRSLVQWMGPKHPYRNFPTVPQIFGLQPGDTVGHEFWPSTFRPPTYYRRVISARSVDSSRGLLILRGTDFIGDWMSGTFGYRGWPFADSIPLFYRLHSFAFDSAQPVGPRGPSLRITSPGYWSRSALGDSSMSFGISVGSWSFDSSGGRICINAAVDSDGSVGFRAPFGFTGDESGWGNTRLSCYRVGGQGIPCGPMIMVSVQDALSLRIRLKQQPVHQTLELQEPGAYTLRLDDLQGRTVRTAAGTHQLDVRILPAGLYALRVTDDQGRSTTLRVVKE